MKRATTNQEQWRSILEEVRQIASRSGSGVRLRRKLNELERAVADEIEGLNEARRKRIVGPRARVRAATYRIEDSPRGPALTERRPEAEARPYKVPLALYRAVTAAVADSPEPQTFAAIKAAAGRRLREEIPDYVARVSLRFWSANGLIRHGGARFTRVGPKAEFKQAVKQAWMQAEAEPQEVQPTQP